MEVIMKPGDLVELCNEHDDLLSSHEICVAEEGNDNSGNQYIEAGTLVVYLGKKKSAPDPAVVILIDGRLGWVWLHEIRPIAHSGGPQ
jgi:hypothetical protein